MHHKYLISDYPNEKERIIFDTNLLFKNIIYNDIYEKIDHESMSSALYLYQQIIYHKCFVFRKDIFNNDTQNNIIKLMKQTMSDKDNYINYEIDPYLLDIFKCINQHLSQEAIKTQKHEFDQLNDNLKSIFLSEWVPWINDNWDISFEWADTIIMNVATQQLKSSQFLEQGKELTADITTKVSTEMGEMIEFSLNLRASSMNDIDIWIFAIEQEYQESFESVRVCVQIEIPQLMSYKISGGNITKNVRGIQFASIFTQQMLDSISEQKIDVVSTILIVPDIAKPANDDKDTISSNIVANEGVRNLLAFAKLYA